jgi:hypothetical protein
MAGLSALLFIHLILLRNPHGGWAFHLFIRFDLLGFSYFILTRFMTAASDSMAKESFLIDFATILARKKFAASNHRRTGVHCWKRYFFFLFFFFYCRDTWPCFGSPFTRLSLMMPIIRRHHHN